MQPESIADRYRVLRAVGKGGMGTVWLCTDERLRREVAVKQIGSLPGESPHDTARAMREARLAAALNHKNAVSIFDVVEQDRTTWLVMEYLPSQTLAQLIAFEGRLAPSRVAHIGAQVAAALSSAHSLGIVHRDIKPGNILVGEDVAKISDFGIARGHQDMQLTQTGMMSGTPGYFSPELARGGDPTPASDVWALGVTLYAATEGAPPYDARANPLAILSAITRDPVPPPTHAGPLTGVLAGMLARDPGQRWTMAESLAALERIELWADPTARAPDATTVLAQAAATAPAATAAPAGPAAVGGYDDQRDEAEPSRGGGRFNRAAITLLALLVLVAAGALVWSTLDLGGGDSPSASPGRDQPGPNAPGTSGPNTSGPSNTDDGGPTTAGPTTEATTDQAGGSPASDPEGFTRSYFGIVPDDLDRGWSLIAPSMQQGLGRESYDDFWESIEAVTVTDVAALDDETVQYQIVYEFEDGGTSSETKQLTLQASEGSYLITSDSTVG